MTAPSLMLRRIEDGALVIWHPGLTLWATLWDGTNHSGEDADPNVRLDHIRSSISKDAQDIQTSQQGDRATLSYALNEDGQDGLYFKAFTAHEDIWLTAYYDSADDKHNAQSIIDSLTYAAG
ncbi:MAG: hypothetical protein ACPGVT_06635 [Maricaulaceae bacterium]